MRAYLRSYEQSDGHKVPVDVDDLRQWDMNVLSVVQSAGYPVRPLSCLTLLSSGVWPSQSGFDLHTHSGSVPAFARPLEDDTIQCWDGSWEPGARRLFVRGC